MNGFFKFGSPIIELSVEKRKISMLLDTGFNGHIMLPNSIIKEIGLDQIGISDYSTASGDNKITKVYIGSVFFLNKDIEVPVLSTDADFSLAGMELFHECKIIIERNKGLVEVAKSK